jgi:tetratricopeptide (TPR) repeat protein
MGHLSGLFLTVLILLPLPGLTNEVVVRPGETLSEIADRYGVTVRELMHLNNLDNPGLWAGSRIQVPTGSGIGSSGNRQGENLKTVDRLIKEAKALIIDGRGQEKRVIELASRILQIEESADAHNIRGVARERLGDVKGALEDYTRSISIDPRHYKALGNRATLKFGLGDLPGSLYDYSQAILIQPDYVNAYIGRSRTLVELGDGTGAIKDITYALGRDPSNPAAYIARSTIYSRLARHDEAVADCALLLKMRPDADSYIFCASIKHVAERFHDSIAEFSTAMSLLPTGSQYDEVVLLKSRSLIAAEEYNEALSELTRLIARSNSHGIAYTLRGIVNIKTHQTALACADWEKAKALGDVKGAVLHSKNC